ncbi:hypothetical protein Tco_0456917, partial [Tanacetum coccineum]
VVIGLSVSVESESRNRSGPNLEDVSTTVLGNKSEDTPTASVVTTALVIIGGLADLGIDSTLASVALVLE